MNFLDFPSIQVDPELVTFHAYLTTVHPETSIALKGTTVPEVALRWALNTTVDSLKVNDVTLQSNQDALIVSGPFTSDQSWKLEAWADGKKTGGTAKLTFLNWAFWGTLDTAPTTSIALLALSSSYVATSTIKRVGYYCPPGTTKRPVYAMPSRLGTPGKVKVSQIVPTTPGTVEWASFTDFTRSTVSFTNQAGFTENYVVMIFNSLPHNPYFEVLWD